MYGSICVELKSQYYVSQSMKVGNVSIHFNVFCFSWVMLIFIVHNCTYFVISIHIMFWETLYVELSFDFIFCLLFLHRNPIHCYMLTFVFNDLQDSLVLLFWRLPVIYISKPDWVLLLVLYHYAFILSQPQCFLLLSRQSFWVSVHHWVFATPLLYSSTLWLTLVKCSCLSIVLVLSCVGRPALGTSSAV